MDNTKTRGRKMKLVYILPKYSDKEPTHFSHTINYLAELSEKCDLAIIIEKGEGNPQIGRAFCITIPPCNKFSRLLKIRRELIKLVKQGYNKIYTHCGLIGSTAANSLKSRYDVTTYYWHCGLSHIYEKESSHLETYIFKKCIRETDFLITGTPKMKEYYHTQYGKSLSQILIIPNDIDLKNWFPSEEQKEESPPRVLFVHRLSPRKGADKIIEIAEKVWDKNIEVIFDIVGDGSYMDDLKEQINRLTPLRKMSIRVQGSIPNNQVHVAYEQATLLFMPSEEEGFPRVLLEAMSLGVPFVATDVGGVKDVISPEQEKYLSVYDDIDVMVNNIVHLIDNLEERKRLVISNLEHVKKYDTQIVVNETLKVLDEN